MINIYVFKVYWSGSTPSPFTEKFYSRFGWIRVCKKKVVKMSKFPPFVKIHNFFFRMNTSLIKICSLTFAISILVGFNSLHLGSFTKFSLWSFNDTKHFCVGTFITLSCMFNFWTISCCFFYIFYNLINFYFFVILLDVFLQKLFILPCLQSIVVGCFVCRYRYNNLIALLLLMFCMFLLRLFWNGLEYGLNWMFLIIDLSLFSSSSSSFIWGAFLMDLKPLVSFEGLSVGIR